MRMCVYVRNIILCAGAGVGGSLARTLDFILKEIVVFPSLSVNYFVQIHYLMMKVLHIIFYSTELGKDSHTRVSALRPSVGGANARRLEGVLNSITSHCTARNFSLWRREKREDS